MRVLRDSSPRQEEWRHSVLALGNFDGLHQGHQAIIRATLETAAQLRRPAGVLTFEPHPRRVFQPDSPPLRIQPFSRKVHMLKEMGIGFVRVVRFTRAFASQSAQQFIRTTLLDELHVKHVVTGEDFSFGHQRAGNARFLRECGEQYGFGATSVAPVLVDGERCSSTRLRVALAEGNMNTAARLLGRPYSIAGIVREGDKRGRLIGFPTANLVPAPLFLPASGVYAVQAILGDGQKVKGVANLGMRPTFQGSQMRLETHLFDWNGDLYGRFVQVQLLTFLRSEKRFENVAALTRQIHEDAKLAQESLCNFPF